MKYVLFGSDEIGMLLLISDYLCSNRRRPVIFFAFTTVHCFHGLSCEMLMIKTSLLVQSVLRLLVFQLLLSRSMFFVCDEALK